MDGHCYLKKIIKKSWLINSQHHSNSHADCWTMRGIFPPVSFSLFFYFYPHTEGLHQCPVFPNAIKWNSEFTGLHSNKDNTQREHFTLSKPPEEKKNIYIKNTANMTIQKNQTKQHQQKNNHNNKRKKSSWLFSPPSVVDKVHIVWRHGLVTISAHAVARTLKTERGAREERRGEAMRGEERRGEEGRWCREHHSSSLSDVCQPLGGEHR